MTKTDEGAPVASVDGDAAAAMEILQAEKEALLAALREHRAEADQREAEQRRLTEEFAATRRHRRGAMAKLSNEFLSTLPPLVRLHALREYFREVAAELQHVISAGNRISGLIPNQWKATLAAEALRFPTTSGPAADFEPLTRRGRGTDAVAATLRHMLALVNGAEWYGVSPYAHIDAIAEGRWEAFSEECRRQSAEKAERDRVYRETHERTTQMRLELQRIEQQIPELEQSLAEARPLVDVRPGEPPPFRETVQDVRRWESELERAKARKVEIHAACRLTPEGQVA